MIFIVDSLHRQSINRTSNCLIIIDKKRRRRHELLANPSYCVLLAMRAMHWSLRVFRFGRRTMDNFPFLKTRKKRQLISLIGNWQTKFNRKKNSQRRCGICTSNCNDDIPEHLNIPEHLKRRRRPARPLWGPDFHSEPLCFRSFLLFLTTVTTSVMCTYYYMLYCVFGV